MLPKPEFRIKVGGFYVPNIRVQRAADGDLELAVRAEIGIQNENGSTQDEVDLGWFVVKDSDRIEYRDETAWALLPREMKQASLDKGWNACTPRELIGILWDSGVIY